MSGKYFDKHFKIGPLDIVVEGALTHHIVGPGSVEWHTGKAKTYVKDTGEPYTVPAYLNIDTNLPFSWFRVSIEKDNK